MCVLQHWGVISTQPCECTVMRSYRYHVELPAVIVMFVGCELLRGCVLWFGFCLTNDSQDSWMRGQICYLKKCEVWTLVSAKDCLLYETNSLISQFAVWCVWSAHIMHNPDVMCLYVFGFQNRWLPWVNIVDHSWLLLGAPLKWELAIYCRWLRC